MRELYKRYRARLGDEAGSIQNFAQSKINNTERWQELQELYREIGRISTE